MENLFSKLSNNFFSGSISNFSILWWQCGGGSNYFLRVYFQKSPNIFFRWLMRFFFILRFKYFFHIGMEAWVRRNCPNSATRRPTTTAPSIPNGSSCWAFGQYNDLHITSIQWRYIGTFTRERFISCEEKLKRSSSLTPYPTHDMHPNFPCPFGKIMSFAFWFCVIRIPSN